MQALAGGRDAALGELMQRWQGPVRCFISRMVRNPALADDVSQEVWTRLYLYRKRYDPRKAFKAYLFTIALNCCRTALAKRGRADTPAMDYTSFDDLPAATPSPAEPMEIAEATRGLHRAIATLPETQRAVVLLYLLCGANYARIADILGHSASTTRSLMHHALVKLRAKLTRLTLAEERRVDHDRLEC